MVNTQVRTFPKSEPPLIDFKQVAITQAAGLMSSILKDYGALSPLEQLWALQLVANGIVLNGLEQEWKK
jgi:hypothetical protein